MSNLAEYFEKNRYKPSYLFGERVFGYWNKIPFIGSVGNEGVVSDLEGPRITITLDLPIKFENDIHNVIIVKHKDIKSLLRDYNASGVPKAGATDSKPVGSGFESHPTHQDTKKSKSSSLLENLKKLKGKK